MFQNIDTLPFSYMLTEKFIEDYDRSSGNPATVQNNFSRTMNLGTVLDKKTVEITGNTATFKSDEPGDYYVFVRDKGIKEVTVTYPTTSKQFKNLNRGFFIELGYLDKDTDMSFRDDTNEDQLLIEVFKFDFDTLKKVVNKINSYADYKMISFREDRINYTLNVKEEGKCLVTLPYDTGFKVLVDGNEVEYEKIFDFFLGFKLDKGNHEILITYVPTGFNIGVLTSLIGILLLISMFVLDKKKIIQI